MSAFMWAILTACIWGIVPLLEKAGLSKVDAIVGLFYRCLGVIIGLVILGAVMLKPQQIKAVDIRSVSWLILAGFLASFVAQITFYKGLKLGEMSRIVPISASYPLITFILGVLILGESITWLKCAGVFSIMIGIWMLRVG